ncbi:MAG TPA: EAL domain-containing protein [Bacilli bacterium]
MNSKSNILIVDDRPENLLVLEAILSSGEINLIRAQSGEEALKHVLKEEFALILLDVQMPGIDGFETAKIIKSREKSKDIPIIFITAINKDQQHIFTGYSVGAIDYMCKPFEPETLKSKVEAFVKLHLNNKTLAQQTEKLRQGKEELEASNIELSRRTAELQRAEAMARIIGETSIDSVIIFDKNLIILYTNPAVVKIFGYPEGELHGQNLSILLPAFENKDLGYKSTEKKLFEIKAERGDGTTFPAEIQIGEALIHKKWIYACTIRDITERKEQLAALEHMALHDDLTGLPNRNLLYSRLQGIIAGGLEKGQSFALLVFDLDHFKSINDTLGHHHGDTLLKNMGPLLQGILNPSDIMVRLGGDEFAILMPDSGSHQAKNMAAQIISLINQPFELDGITITIGTSLGIVVFPEHGADAATLLRLADIAMYDAKRIGNGYSIYSAEQDINDPIHLIIMGELHKAIENNDLVLYYQPKVNMNTGEVTDVEALVRWHHAKFGFIQPSDFIPMAEQLGLIKPLTLWVLNEAIRQCSALHEEGLNVRMAVNLSVRSLQDFLFPDQIAHLLNLWKVSPDKLVLEITESIIMADPIRALDVLKRLDGMGIILSIDDFGTGYSSLAYLKKLPVEEIKVDKSFVMDMAQDRNDAMIVHSTISLAHNLGLKVVAEGVETKEIWNLLAALGCDEAQGFYMSRPLPHKELTAWLKDPKWDKDVTFSKIKEADPQ